MHAKNISHAFADNHIGFTSRHVARKVRRDNETNDIFSIKSTHFANFAIKRHHAFIDSLVACFDYSYVFQSN